MRVIVAAIVGLMAAGPAVAQNLNDIGRALTDQLIPRQQQQPNRDTNAYEQGRRDQQEQSRREQDARRSDDRYREDDRRRGYEDKRRSDYDRERAERERALAEDQRARSGRY